MTVIDVRDLRVSVSFAEEEARFLAALLGAVTERLTEEQSDIAIGIAMKFLLETRALNARLEQRYGRDALHDAWERALEAIPDRMIEVQL